MAMVMMILGLKLIEKIKCEVIIMTIKDMKQAVKLLSKEWNLGKKEAGAVCKHSGIQYRQQLWF